MTKLGESDLGEGGRPLRICIVSDTYAPDVNGVAMSLERFTEGFLKRGNAVTIATPVKGAGERFLSYPTFTRFTVDSVPFPGYAGLKLGLPSGTRFKSRWRDTPPDIIYVATESVLGYSAIKAAQRLGIPVASGFHTNFHSYSKDYHMPFLEEIASSYLKKIHNETAMTFCPCLDVANKLREEGFERVEVVGRGIDTELFKPSRRSDELRQRWGADADTPVAIYVGRIAAEKNLGLVVEAFTRIQEQSPGSPCVFVGDGLLFEEMKEKHPGFIWEGAKRGEELASMYASADLFVFPSMSETYGNVIVEAMASGLCGIAFRYAAPAEFIEDGENGFLAAFDDEAEFLEKVDQALARSFDQDLRGAAADAASDCSWDSIVADFEAKLRTAL